MWSSGGQKRAICFVPLLLNKLNSDVEHFATHELACMAGVKREEENMGAREHACCVQGRKERNACTRPLFCSAFL